MKDLESKKVLGVPLGTVIVLLVLGVTLYVIQTMWGGKLIGWIRKIKAVVSAEVVASGGAGTLEHFYEAVEAGATVLLAASVFHFRIIAIGDLKAYLRQRGVRVP